MKVGISAILELGGSTLVHCSCAAGDFSALWASDEPVPEMGVKLFVELDIDGVVQLDRNAFLVEAQNPEISQDDGMIRIVGVVESLDDDGLAYFRLAPDCLIMVETEGEFAPPGSGLRLELEAELLRIYSY